MKIYFKGISFHVVGGKRGIQHPYLFSFGFNIPAILIEVIIIASELQTDPGRAGFRTEG